ncbi:hypothetical protein RI845_18000 [Thalassotalea nanhaiensis]|uniref:Uncharacterized protein n=1 Tax=Thalassotalea nanhaiensis TaxID=3065648 RepID=A0ABY9THU2_9GAMM|nr:hypothetical protein RI845_18000 [Colwelliaceae bacterium SQ345]
MSTLVVVKKNGYATIACDSLSTDGTMTVPSDNKINNHKYFKVNNSFIGFVGWSNINNIFEDIIENNPAILEFTDRKSIFNSLNNLHPILKDEYYINTLEDDDQSAESSQISGLILTPKGIFEFCSYRSVDEYSKYWAVGGGSKIRSRVNAQLL